MKRLLVSLLLVVLGAGSAAARSDSTYEDYRTRLRREIAERARELRDAKRYGDDYDGNDGRYNLSRRREQRHDRRDSKRSNPLAVDLANPFGPGMDFAAQAWENADQGNYGLFSTRRRRDNKRARQDQSRPLDLSGLPLNPIQTSRMRQPAPAPAPRKEVDPEAKKKKEEALKEATTRAIQAAQLLFDNGDFGAARRMLVPIASSIRRPPEEVEAAGAFIQRIDEQGMKQVVEADEALANGDTETATEGYDEVAQKYGSSPAAKLARSKLAVLRATPEVAARYLYDRARFYADKKRPDIAIPLFREVEKRHPKSEFAAKAKEQREELEKQMAAESALTAEQILAARKLLIIGDIHALNGRVEKARRSYQAVIQDFEDSKYADAAREKLEHLSPGTK